MALPKKVKKNINIAPQAIQPHYPDGYNGLSTPIRRKELADYITEDGTFLPKSVLHEDMDLGMLTFVQDELTVALSGKKINVIDKILTLQRWGEFTETWSFSTEDKNVELPFIVVVRKPDVQYGSNPSLLYTIPDRKQFHFAKVPTWDGNRKGMDVYTIPQPVPVDITYDVKIVSNRMRELNVFNRKVMQKFTSRQAYTFVKGHYIPIILSSLSDESVIDTEDRRYYQQNYQFQLQGFLIDEEEFEVKPAITRNLLFFDFDNYKPRGNSSSSEFQSPLPLSGITTAGMSNTGKLRRKVTFDAGCSPCVDVKTYQYENNISIVRSANINTNTITISPNTVATWTPVNVKLGETATITITQIDSTQDSYLVVEEVLIPSGANNSY